MPLYPLTLAMSAMVSAMCSGFILAASPHKRATQLASALLGGTALWAMCEAQWNSAADPQVAAFWMHLSTPGWCFIGGILPHLMARYLDLYPSAESERLQPRLIRFAGVGYSAGVVVLLADVVGDSVHGPPIAVPWGWTYSPGSIQIAFFCAIGLGLMVTVVAMLNQMRSPIAVAPLAQRFAIRTAILLSVVLTPLTDIALPLLGIPFPRLGSTGYALFALLALVMSLGYGMTFFTPKRFSEEILETLHEGVAMITPSGLVRRVNRGFAKLVGHDADALIGMELCELLDWQVPEYGDAVEEQQAELISYGGDVVPVSVSSMPLQDERGNGLGRVVVVRDLREIEEMRRRMLIQARLAAVGELVAGLAHEMNNPLAFVRSNLSMLERHAKTLADVAGVSADEREEIVRETTELVEESLLGVDRAAEIVRGVRRFTHAGSPTREHADLNELLEDAAAMLRPRLRPRDVALRIEAGSLPEVFCAPQEIRQVLVNLLVNALDAVESGGRVKAETRHEAEDVLVEVTDDGCGMSSETIERIFDPFFSTKRVGDGTGLGLGIAWNIVNSHGGQIDVESTPDVGTVFRVRLPVAG